MSSYKTLKSVAHNVGHSFLSDMNYVRVGGRRVVVPQEIFEIAQQAAEPVVTVDLLSGSVRPPPFATCIVLEAVELYGNMLQQLVQFEGFERASVLEASLELRFDLAASAPSPANETIILPSVACTVALLDDRGRMHLAHPKKWWRT